MEGYPDIETYISDLNALIHDHQMKMATIFAQRDVVTKLLKDQVTVCDTLAESIKNSQSSVLLKILNHLTQVFHLKLGFKILSRQWPRENIMMRN